MIAEAAVSGLESFADRLAVEEIEWLGRRPSGGEGEGEIGVTAMYEREGKSNGGEEGEEEGEEEEVEEGEMEEGEREKEEVEDNNIEKQGGGEGEGDGEGGDGEGEGEGDLVLNIDKVDNSDNNDEPHSHSLSLSPSDSHLNSHSQSQSDSHLNSHSQSQSQSHTQSDLQDDDPVYSCLPPSIGRNYPSTPHPIGSYTIPPGAILPLELETLWLPVEVLEAHWAARRLSIVGQYDRRSYCFTHSYGRLYDKSSGSVYWEVSFRVN